jgi:predicted lipoprotein with Yx(FWY)xxD motif
MLTKSSGLLFAVVVAGLLLAGCGGVASTNSNPGTAASAGTAALIHTQSMTIGSKTETVLKNAKGLTLYYFTADTPTTIVCTSGCARNWPPLLSSEDHPTSNPTLPGTLTVMNGPNGNQVLYNGHPLYTYFKDGDSGDAYGQGIGGKWFAATPDLAAAAAASASASKTYGAY